MEGTQERATSGCALKYLCSAFITEGCIACHLTMIKAQAATLYSCEAQRLLCLSFVLSTLKPEPQSLCPKTRFGTFVDTHRVNTPVPKYRCGITEHRYGKLCPGTPCRHSSWKSGRSVGPENAVN